MGAPIMKINSSPGLLKEVREEFSRNYPFLKIAFVKKTGGSQSDHRAPLAVVSDEQAGAKLSAAGQLLWNEFAISDNMTVAELEVLLQYQFGLAMQIMRKSGNLWMETRMTRHWTLRQQNEHGKDIAWEF